MNTPQTQPPASLGAATGSPFPFECENCGHKPTPQEVLDHHGDCAKCRDTVITYTVDAAECIVRLMANDPSSPTAAEFMMTPKLDALATSPASNGSANVARENGIKEIRYLCDEALDHQTGWKSFCEMVRHRLEIETAFVEMASSTNVAPSHAEKNL